MDRYKCLVVINKEPYIFKRYGKDEDDVRSILTEFVQEAFGVSCNIKTVEKDKNHPVVKTKEVTNA